MNSSFKKAFILMAFLISCSPAFAYDFKVGDLCYELLSETTCAVTYGDGTYEGDITIPSEVTYEGKTISVTNIGNSAFYYCLSLTNIIIPSSITKIGARAFSCCISLTSITIPNSVTSIDKYAFEGCSSLASIAIPNSVTSIGKFAFKACSSLASVIIPNSVTSIGVYAFEGCSSLVSVTIPNSLTSIGRMAFSGCSSLASVTIPNSVTSIGVYAFEGCSSLVSVTIPNSLTSIEGMAFSGCSSLKKMVSMAVTPPVCGGKVFSGINWECTLYVPEKSVNAYKSAPEWRDFYNIETGIKTVSTSASATEVERYTTGGTRIASPQKGINIIKMSDGTVKKVLVK